jgi:hypothetical protein
MGTTMKAAFSSVISMEMLLFVLSLYHITLMIEIDEIYGERRV